MSVRKILGAAAGGSTSAVSSMVYVDDIFSTYLYTGTGSTQSINTGIDLTVSGGMVWSATRSGTTDTNGPEIIDTVNGGSKRLITANTNAQYNLSDPITFTSTGITAGATVNTYINSSGFLKVLWTFKKAAKFFDVVTYTGNSTQRTISHSLGVNPGMIIIKRTDATSNWYVYHVSSTTSAGMIGLCLNLTDAQADFGNNHWYLGGMTTTTFGLGNMGNLNGSGGSYIAYLFAHDTATDGAIQCGSYVGNNTNTVSVSLGWEPQFVMIKEVTNGYAASTWGMFDCIRGMPINANTSRLLANSNQVEDVLATFVSPTPTGFNLTAPGTTATSLSGATYIYIAIRRSKKIPTSGTQVFAPVLYTGNSGAQTITTGFPVDLEIVNPRSAQGWNCGFIDRVRGPGRYLSSDSTNAEVDSSSSANQFQSNTGTNRNSVYFNASPTTFVDYAFKRAVGFFDIAAWVGTGTLKTVSHNLGVTPELIIVKHREVWPGQTWTYDWAVYYGVATSYLVLNTSAAAAVDAGGNNRFGALATSTNFTVGNVSETNSAGGMHYVGYLFATLAGVSKVGSYTGNGSSQTINCGFASGARFILIKCTSASGDWYVWDSARGIIAANDPHSSLNTNTAEVTTDDSVDPDNTGFIINQNVVTNINVTSATYIFLAIA